MNYRQKHLYEIPITRKIYVFFLCCCMLLCCLMPSDSAVQELDLEIIVAGLRNYNELIQSGSADIIFKMSQYDSQDRQLNSLVSRRRITFDSHRTLLESAAGSLERTGDYGVHLNKKTILVKKNGWLSADHYKTREDYYMFGSVPPDPEVTEVDPRHLTMGMWGGGPLPDYLVKRGFSVISKEKYKDALCYVLECSKPYRGTQRLQRIWISPEHGFGYLKSEAWSILNPMPGRGFEKKMPGVSRQRISYQENGGAWFPKKYQYELSWIDDKGKEHPKIKQEIEVNNLRLNYKIPDDIFTIEIADDARIWISDLSKYLSKEKYLSIYGSAFNEE